MKKENIHKRYTKAAEKYSAKATLAEKRLFLLSMLRLICFAGGIILTWTGFYCNVLFGISALTVTLLLFFFLLKKYSYQTKQKEYYSKILSKLRLYRQQSR
jgi:hypothetical protein